MSGLGRKRVSKWDSKEDANHHHHSIVNAKPGSYYRDKEPEPLRFNGESNSNRRSTAADDQHSGEARTRSRVSQNNDNSYYSEQDDRQHFFRRSGSRSNSRSRSRSRSRSPVYKGRRDTGSYDRHKNRTRGSPLPIREFNKRANDNQFDPSSDYGWDDRVRKPRETNYHTDDFREPMKKGVRSSDYNTDFSEDHSRRELLHDGVPDPRLRRHRSEFMGEKDSQRRDGDGDGDGEFLRSSNIPCKFFAAGFCRNGKYCRFSHHGSDRKPPQDNNFCRQDNDNYSGHNKWSDVERLDNGKFGGIKVSRVSKGFSESKGNGSGWIDDMEMSPDWDYGVKSLKNPVKEENGVSNIGQSSQSRVFKDDLVTNYDRKSSAMLLHGSKTMVEKPLMGSHQSYSNPVNVPPVQEFNQTHNVLPYQSSLTAGGSQQVPAASAADLAVGSNLSNLESGQVYQNNHHSTVEKPVLVQNTVSKEQIDQISNISATLVQFLANGQPIPQLKQALQLPLHSESSMAVQPNQATTALHAQSNSISNPNQLWRLEMSSGAEGVPAVTASQVSNIDETQMLEPNPKVSEENVDKRTDEASKEEEVKKTEEETNDAENVADEDEDDDDDDDDDGSDKENKKEKDLKGIRAFKFALVEVVKELLKPAWKEGKMKKDGYKSIVKKVVEKVTSTMQSGNVPQTQEKIEHYLSTSKPKLTKLVQAYISKTKKT